LPVLTLRLQRTRLIPLAAIAAALLVGHATPAQAKVRSSVTGQLLNVAGGRGSDRIAVTCTGGLAKVNGKNPSTGEVACGKVSEIDVSAGAGNDRVNLAGVGSDSGFGQRDLPGGFGHGTGCGVQLGDGNDSYVGGKSCFNLVLAGRGNDRVTGGNLRDELQGGAGDDSMAGGAGRDVLLGNGGNDKLNGGADDDLLSGNAGDDTLIGGPGNDLLGGGAGMDRLAGGPGDDQLIGGPGKDTLNGGPGNNTLVQDSPTKK
jgi:Ca2+-binding RTX toxin-like protein